jgi:hypothetical protein
MEEVGMALSGASALVNISEDAVKVSKHQMTWGQFGSGLAVNVAQIGSNFIGVPGSGAVDREYERITKKLAVAGKNIAEARYRGFIFRGIYYEGKGVTFQDLEMLRTTAYGDLQKDPRMLYFFGGGAKTTRGQLNNVMRIHQNFSELEVLEREDLKYQVEYLEAEQFHWEQVQMENKDLLRMRIAAGRAAAGVLNNALPGIRVFETGVSTQESKRLGTQSTTSSSTSATTTSITTPTTTSTIASAVVTANPTQIESLVA